MWLNLTDGAVLCGKWFFDGSGGNGHALEHYRETNYPLAVKLDTITPDGAGPMQQLNIYSSVGISNISSKAVAQMFGKYENKENGAITKP